MCALPGRLVERVFLARKDPLLRPNPGDTFSLSLKCVQKTMLPDQGKSKADSPRGTLNLSGPGDLIL